MLTGAVWIVVYIITGAGVLVAAVLGASWLLAKQVNAGHGEGCGCPACQAKRVRAWKRKHPNQADAMSKWIGENVKPPPGRSNWLSTLEIQPGLTVLGRNGGVYRIASVRPIPYGFAVTLVNPLTGKESRILIDGKRAHHKIWLAREPKTGGSQ